MATEPVNSEGGTGLVAVFEQLVENWKPYTEDWAVHVAEAYREAAKLAAPYEAARLGAAKRLRETERSLGELLAVIFRDGGHRQAEINDVRKAGEEAAQEIYGLIAKLEALQSRLDDAETTISKIGFCSPTPDEAQRKYEAKYKVNFRDIEHRVGRLPRVHGDE